MNAGQMRQMRNSMQEIATAIASQTEALLNFNRVSKEANKQKKKSIDLSKLEKKELRDTVAAQEGLNKRNKILKTALELNNNQLKFGAKSWKDYKKAGGTSLEYLATFMTSTKEEVRLFGIEAASARRFMYGFLPPGMFRLVNKLSTAFNGIGSAMRSVRDGTKGSNNAFTTMLKLGSKVKKLGALSGSGAIMKATSAFKNPKGAWQRNKKMSGRIKSEQGDLNELIIKMNDAKMKGKGANVISAYEKKVAKKQDKIAKMQKSRTKILEKSKMGRFILNMQKFPKAVMNIIKMAGKFFMMAMLYVSMFFIIAYMLYNSIGKAIIEGIKNAWPAIKMALGVVMEGLTMIWDGAMSIWDAFFGDGDLSTMLDGLVEMGLGILLTVGGFVLTVLVATASILWETGVSLFWKLYDWVVYTFFTSWDNFKSQVPVILGVVAFFLMTFWFQAALFPAIVIGLLVYWIGKKIDDWFGFLAVGGAVDTPLQVVGEKGPELVAMKKGSRVYSNKDSKKMISGSRGSTVNNFNITINAKDTSNAELRRVADAVGKMISEKVNRRTSSRTMM